MGMRLQDMQRILDKYHEVVKEDQGKLVEENKRIRGEISDAALSIIDQGLQTAALLYVLENPLGIDLLGFRLYSFSYSREYYELTLDGLRKDAIKRLQTEVKEHVEKMKTEQEAHVDHEHVAGKCQVGPEKILVNVNAKL